MKITIDKKILETNLDLMAKAKISSSTVIELTGILFLVDQEKITLISSNGEMFIKKELINKIDVMNIEQIGNSLIPAGLLRNLIRKLNGKIEINVKNKIAYIKNEDNLYTINCLNAVEYPNYDFTYLNEKIQIPSKYIKSIINNVSFAAAVFNINEIFTGINLKAKDGVLTATSTDRYRIATQKFKISPNADFNVVILAKDFKDVFSDVKSKTVELAIDVYKLNVFYDKTVFQCRLIDKPYIAFEGIIKKFHTNQPDKKLVIKKQVLKKHLEQISFLFTENHQQIDLVINSDIIKIQTTRNEIGSGKIDFTDFTYKGEEIKLTLNAKFLSDAIRLFTGEVKIYLTDHNSPLFICSEEIKELFQVITPIRSH